MRADTFSNNMTFSKLIRSQEALLHRLLVVSQRQLELAKDGNVTILTQHLEQRLLLWNEFEVLEQQLAPHKGVPSEEREWKSAEERQMTEVALNRCKELMEQILAIDQTSLETVTVKKDEVGEQVRRIQQGAPVADAYRKQSRGRC